MEVVLRDEQLPPVPKEKFCGEGEPANVVERRQADERHVGGLRAAVVDFPPATRTRWHVHSGEQILFVISGRGWCQLWDGEPQEIGEGDAVRVDPGEKHWHGAQAVHASGTLRSR